MKTIAFLFYLLLLVSTLIAQRFPETEVVFHTIGASSSNQETIFEYSPFLFETIFEDQTVSFPTLTYRYLNLIGCSNGAKYPEITRTVKLKGNVSCQYSGLKYIFYNEDWDGEESCGGKAEFRPFANALYEIKIKVAYVEKFKFYLDTRHDNLPNGCGTNCSGNDISLVYNIANNTVGAAKDFWQGGILKTINYGHYYTWWELRESNCGIALSKFNQHYMPILLEPVNQNNSPFLQWNKATGTGAAGQFFLYDLQRSLNNGHFISIFQTYDFHTTSYLDYAVLWVPGQPLGTVHYRVAAIYEYFSGYVADVSNYQVVNDAHLWINWKKSASQLKTDNMLNNNYPNPFNPSTKISYQISVKGYVNLIVYDALGREIKRLVEEFKEPGYYTIDFDASNLNSGVYFYTLRVNNYTQTKQMILVK